MKITVVTPSFNQGAFIRRCIDSVRLQSGSFAIEHIILDNCSTDNTAEELRDYAANPGNVEVRIVIEKDAGQTAAINTGFDMATGSIICWLNTDEWFEPTTLRRIAHCFEDHPDIDVLYGDCNFVDADGRIVHARRESTFSLPMLLYYGCYMQSCSTFVRKSVFDAGVRLDPSFKVTMDFEWYVRIAKSGFKIQHFPFTLASFMWHGENISSRLVERRLVERRMVQDRYSAIASIPLIRVACYGTLRYFWIGIRVARRLAGRTFAESKRRVAW